MLFARIEEMVGMEVFRSDCAIAGLAFSGKRYLTLKPGHTAGWERSPLFTQLSTASKASCCGFAFSGALISF